MSDKAFYAVLFVMSFVAGFFFGIDNIWDTKPTPVDPVVVSDTVIVTELTIKEVPGPVVYSAYPDEEIGAYVTDEPRTYCFPLDWDND